MYCGLSASGNGLYCIVELQCPEEHTQQFYAMEKDFLDMGIIIDPSCKDVTRLRFFSYDDNAYYNEDAVSYNKRLDHSETIKEDPINNKSINNQTNLNFEIMKKNEVTVEELMEQMAKSTFENIRFFMGNRSHYTWKEREVYDALEPVLASQTDITQRPLDWFIICNRIVVDFRESGRGLFHDVCQFYLDYTEKECDELYDKCLKKSYNYSRTKFFEILKFYGF